MRRLRGHGRAVAPVAPASSPPSGSDALLLESGDFLLLESGDKLLLE